MAEGSKRHCEVVQQIKFLAGYPDHWRECLVEKLEAESNILCWAFILHDKDIKEDGTPVEPHVHIVIKLQEGCKPSTIGGYLGIPGQYVTSIRQVYKAGKRYYADLGGGLSYLTHRNAPGKFQYADEEVTAKPGFDWLAERTKSEQRQAAQKSLARVLDDIGEGKIRRYNVYNHVSMSDYINNKQEFERAFEYREGMLKQNVNRTIDVIYITGDAGAGKTSLAKLYCEKKQWSYCLSGSSRDPMQDYNGQDALILDDLRPDVLPLSDLLKLLDNHSASSASARYHDRWLEVKAIIVTTVLSIEDFFGQTDRMEPIAQLKRRCKVMVRLTRAKLELYTYKSETQEYMLVAHGANPIATLYSTASTDIDETNLKAICEDFGVTYHPEALPSDYVTEDCIPFA